MKKLTAEEFRTLLWSETTSSDQIRPYVSLQQTAGGPFSPSFVPNPEWVESDGLESALSIGNAWCRWRRRRRFQRRSTAGDQSPVIVSEGDSWFQFPILIDDIIDQLENDFLVWSCGAAGDTAEDVIFESPEYMKALDEQAERVRAFLLSIGGNDVIGEDDHDNPVLLKLLYRRSPDRRSPGKLINRAELKRIMDRLERAYRKVVKTVRSDPRFETLPVLIHGYDYPIPYPAFRTDPRRPFWASNNEWLGGPMADKMIDDHDTQKEILKILIDEFYDMLERVGSEDAHVHVVDLRKTLPRVDMWEDEIHATDRGYAIVADKFRRVLGRVIPTP